jgi:hypothetical protein
VKQFETGVRSESYRIGTEGGTVGIAGPGQNSSRSESRTSVLWQGDRLHIVVSRYSGLAPDSGPQVEHSEEWWLDEQDKLHIVVLDRRSDADVVSHTLT